MKKVLIALDYDPTAQKVVEQGYKLSKALGAKIYLLHVIADPVYYASREYSPITGFEGFLDFQPLMFNNAADLKNAANEYLDKVKNHLKDEAIKTLVKEGETADAILKTAAETNADIIVIGSHSRKWLENIIMGSVTERVFHHTSCPLFIIPTKKQE